MLDWTGERFLPWIEVGLIHYEHLHRYAFAKQFVRDKKVIDFACGEGYGSNLLAEDAADVVGIDIDETSIRHAADRYKKENLAFVQGSITDVPIEGTGKFDIAVCFEAIEHIAEQDKLLSEIRRLLNEDGLLIVSTPNKAVYTDAADYKNIFHVKELYYDEFNSLLKHYFKNVYIWGQRVYTGSNIWNISEQKQSYYLESIVEKSKDELQFAERESKEPTYLVAMATNTDSKKDIDVNDAWLVDVSDSFIKSTIRSYEDRINDLIVAQQAKDVQYQFQINQIQRGILIQAASKYQRIVDKVIRPGTWVRRGYELGLTGIRIILNDGWRSFF